MPTRPFGAVLTAMVTPMHEDGSVDLDAAARLADHLLGDGHDGLVVSGTTGEASTTSDAEKRALLRVVVETVAGRGSVVAGVGTNDTHHSVELARQACAAGADGVLVVAPYYSRPSQAGVQAHVRAVADASEVPVMLYDIPSRSGIELTTETLLRVAEHPRVVAVKDAKGDLQAATRVMDATDLAWYSGDDGLTLAHLGNGGVGVVGVTSHVLGPLYARMVAAHDAGDNAGALAEHRRAQPVVDAVMTRMPGVVASKAALQLRGLLGTRTVRLPLLPASEDELDGLRSALGHAGLL